MQPNEHVLQAMTLLRDPSHMQWYVVPLLGFVIYVYAVEVERRNWNAILASAAFLLTDILWEIINALILHFSGTSSLWIVTGNTAYLVLVGLGIEIAFIFAIAGIVFTKFLPKEKNAKIAGLPNRWFHILAFSFFGSFIELLLVQTPYFKWGYSWWGFTLVALMGYLPFYWVTAKVYDSKRRTQVAALAGLASLDLALILVCGVWLRWI